MKQKPINFTYLAVMLTLLCLLLILARCHGSSPSAKHAETASSSGDFPASAACLYIGWTTV